ncbi:MAG: ABC transporter substrate-binding protein [Methanobacteriaceae archaeon]|nr:ABC transporter substrate-binding protein [Methanobacteriaceae archaeon]
MVRHRFIVLILIFFICLLGLWQVNMSNDSETIRVGYLPCDHSAALFIAEANKTFEKNGLNVKSTQLSTGSEIINALSSGKLDLGYVGITPALQAISKGVPIKIVGAVNLEGTGIVVQENSKIQKITDLKGKTIATPGLSSIQHTLLLYELKKYNLTSNDLDIVPMNIYMIPSALAAVKIDAYIAYEPFVSISRYRNTGKVMMFSGEIMKNHPCCVIVARDDFIQKNPTRLKKFLIIHNKTTNYVKSHTEESASMVSKQIISNIEVEKLAMKNVKYVSLLDEEFQQSVMNFMIMENSLGNLNKTLLQEQIFDTRFLGV